MRFHYKSSLSMRVEERIATSLNKQCKKLVLTQSKIHEKIFIQYYSIYRLPDERAKNE